MKVIVDTSVWSLALRRDRQGFSGPVQELQNMIHDHRAQVVQVAMDRRGVRLVLVVLRHRGPPPGTLRDHPEVVARLQARFEKTQDEVPQFPEPKSDYLFKEPAPGQPRVLMRLIGGGLRYDRIPTSQRSLLAKP